MMCHYFCVCLFCTCSTLPDGVGAKPSVYIAGSNINLYGLITHPKVWASAPDFVKNRLSGIIVPSINLQLSNGALDSGENTHHQGMA